MAQQRPSAGRRSARTATPGPTGPVSTRSMSAPRPGWSLADAVRLLESGYRVEQVERMTGFAAAHIRAQVRPERPARDG